MQWFDVKDRMPEYGVEVLVRVDGHRGPAWKNTYNVVAYRSRYDNGFYEERHITNDPLPVIQWAYIE